MLPDKVVTSRPTGAPSGHLPMLSQWLYVSHCQPTSNWNMPSPPSLQPPASHAPARTAPPLQSALV